MEGARAGRGRVHDGESNKRGAHVGVHVSYLRSPADRYQTDEVGQISPQPQAPHRLLKIKIRLLPPNLTPAPTLPAPQALIFYHSPTHDRGPCMIWEGQGRCAAKAEAAALHAPRGRSPHRRRPSHEVGNHHPPAAATTAEARPPAALPALSTSAAAHGTAPLTPNART
jgi:hypothetical protein